MWGIARLNTDGTLDTTFEFVPTGDVETIAVQGDGRILIGGGFSSTVGFPRNHIARLNGDGSLDMSFDPGSGASSNVMTAAVQGDGRIVIGGMFASYDGTARNRIARVNLDGGLDTSFDSGSGADDWVRSVAIQPDGRVLVGGDFVSFNGEPASRFLRLDPDGTLDSTFAVGHGPDGQVSTVAVQGDGRVLIGGTFRTYDGVDRDRVARVFP
jgi:uncharacterized delta-60 repeat protein